MQRYVPPLSQSHITMNPAQQLFSSNTYQTPQLSYIGTQAIQPVLVPQIATATLQSPQIATAVTYQQQPLKQQIQGQSRLEHIPYQRKIIDYEQQVSTTIVPKERLVQDYYTVEHQVNYIPQTIQEPYVEYVPVQRFKERVEYNAVQSSRTVVQPNYNTQYGNVSTVYTGTQYAGGVQSSTGGFVGNGTYSSGFVVPGAASSYIYQK